MRSTPGAGRRRSRGGAAGGLALIEGLHAPVAHGLDQLGDEKRKSLALIAHWELPVQPVADLIAILVWRGISDWRILISIFGAMVLFFRNV